MAFIVVALKSRNSCRFKSRSATTCSPFGERLTFVVQNRSVNETVRPLVGRFAVLRTRKFRPEFAQTSFDGEGAAQPPQQARKPQHYPSLNRRAHVNSRLRCQTMAQRPYAGDPDNKVKRAYRRGGWRGRLTPEGSAAIQVL